MKSHWDGDGAVESAVRCCIVLVHRARLCAATKIVVWRTGNCVVCFAYFARRGHFHSLPFGAVPLWCAKIDTLEETFPLRRGNKK